MRLIDADAFDRSLAAREFDDALHNASDENRTFEAETLYYSTQSFRDVMAHQPTVDAVPKWQVDQIVSWMRDQVAMFERLEKANRLRSELYDEMLAYKAVLKRFDNILNRK